MTTKDMYYNPLHQSLEKSRLFFANYIEDVKKANPKMPRTKIIAMAIAVFNIKNPKKYFRKCVYCDSWDVRQTDGYCSHCNSYSGWYLEPSAEVPAGSALPGRR